MKRGVALLSLLFVGGSALATKIPSTPITKLYERSTVVVFGRIESGRILKDNCGVEFAVRVTTAFKGAKPGALAWYQDAETTQIGTNYFLFLSPHAAGFAPFVPTNTHDPRMLAEYNARCKRELPSLAVNAHGWGSMQALPFSPREVIVDRLVTFPPEVLAATQLKPLDRIYNDDSYTELDTARFAEYLRSLAQLDRRIRRSPSP